MRAIKEFNKKLEIWTTNVEYEKIFNCRVIEPPYEKSNWLYNNDFFLDKRLGMQEFVLWDYHYTDDIELYGNTYYLYHNDTTIHLWVKDGNTIKQLTSNIYSPNNPIKIIKWFWANWIRKEQWLIITNWVELIDNNQIINEDWVYEDWYIVLDVWVGLNIQPWDYVLFNDNIYKWATVEVDLYENGKIYIIGINAKGSIPASWDTIDIYSDHWSVPLIWTNEWVVAVHIDWTNLCSSTIILDGDITDLESFNETIFVLKWEVVYFSSKTFSDNLQFYKSSNRKRIRWAYKMMSKWKFLIILWDDNKLVSSTIETSVSYWEYTMYSLNYSWDLYSKYSYIFTDSSLYMVDSSKQILSVELESLNATAFNMNTKSIIKTVRWLMSNIADYDSPEKWEIYINDNKMDSKIHFLYQDSAGGTTEYEYDKEYTHWLLHTYQQHVYKISNQFLCNWSVSNIGWYEDLWIPYKQSINFTIKTYGLITKVWMIRMIMWISNDRPLLYNVDIDVESSHSITKKHIEVKDMTFDTMPVDHSTDLLNILNNWTDNSHNGNIVSIQRWIMMSGRFHRYDINWYDRFSYWYSYIVAVDSNIFVNERNFSK